MTNTQLQAYFDSKTTSIAKVTATSTDAEITTYVNAIFTAILDRAPSATGLANISAAIKAGTFTELSFVDSAINADITDEAFAYLTTTESANAQAKQITAKAAAEAATAVASGAGVAETTPTDTTSPTTPATDEKQVIVLTDGRDNVTTGSNDDIIYGDAGQNQNGAIANAFSTGDRIDGGAGNDTLITTIVGDNTVDDGSDMAIYGRTTNVEKAVFETIDESVTVDAGNMNSVEEFWSDNSDNVTLTLEDVRLGDKLSITKDITFGMKDVDYNSNLTAQFDSASLVNSGTSKADSKVSIKLIDATALSADKPVGNVEVTLGFKVAGSSYTVDKVVSTDGTYEGLKEAIATDLALKGLTDLSVSIGSNFTELTTGNNTTKALTGVTAKEIVITDGSGDAFSDVTFTQAAVTAVPTGFTVAGVAAPVDPTTSSALIESNLILDNAGRSSTAGDVTIGAMSNSDKGVEQFNVSVDHSSAIALLDTTNNKLQNVVITSLTNKGDLEIGSITNFVAGTTSIDASAFTGSNLMLGATTETTNLTTANAAINNLNTLSANITANVTFNGSTTQTAQNDDNGVYAYTTGSGKDAITFSLDGDSVDANGESFALTTNGGNDTIAISMDAAQTGVSQSTMKLLNNLSIDSGAGADSITVNNYGNFNIAAGSDTDFVRIDSINANGNATATSTTVGTASGSQTWGDAGRVLYNAELTVNFAGLESTVTVATSAATNFVATQMTINDAITAAIAANPELSHLLKTTLVTGTEQMKIESLVGGENNISIDLFQPQLIATGVATAGQTLIASTDVTALRQGLLATETVTNLSADLENASEIAAWTNASDFYGSIATNNAGNKDLSIELSTNTGDEQMSDLVTDGAYVYMNSVALGTDATTDVNYSTINLGDGANDLVVLHSNDLSMNTIVIDGSFGKDTVVNFFDNAPTDADQNHTNVGLHQVDFSTILNNKMDNSNASVGQANNSDSAQAITLTLHDAANTYTSGATAANDAIVTANSVTVLHYDENTSKSVKFDDFTASQLLAELNDQGNTVNTVLGGLSAASVAVTAWDSIATNAASTIVGTTQNSILMVENMANLGEYKVFSATSTLNSTDNTQIANVATAGDDLTTVNELGTLDFGHSVNFNLAGDATSKTMLSNLIAAADDSTETVSVDGVDVHISTTSADVAGSGSTVVPVTPTTPTTPTTPVDPVDPAVTTGTKEITAADADTKLDASTLDMAYTVDAALAGIQITNIEGFDNGDTIAAGNLSLIGFASNDANTALVMNLMDLTDTDPALTLVIETTEADLHTAVDAAADMNAAVTAAGVYLGDGFFIA